MKQRVIGDNVRVADYHAAMRLGQYFLPTLKETPADAEVISHQLMLRAGMIRKTAAGIYSWLPLGLRVLKKVETIVREEMNRAGALEILMPAVQPAELWHETSRFEEYGGELLKITDRHERQFCFGPTHEEIVTDIMRKELKSYKQLPLTVYQVQTKFRDEIRPRFGVMRSREFIMKDAYSFHLDEQSLAQTYRQMFEAYTQIFQRLGLKFRAVWADSGSIGGQYSHEFHVLAETGEDLIAYSDQSDYAANIERAEGLPSADSTKKTKTVLVAGTQTPWVALLLREDHELNPIKAEKLAQVAKPLRYANAEEKTLNVPIIVDSAAAKLNPGETVADIRKVVEGDLSPDGKGHLKFTRGIEVGHIFQLGNKYSKAMKAHVLDEDGRMVTLLMGCYGIGISRIVAAAIEQNHDDNGIIWPAALAPFQIILIPINMYNSELVKTTSEQLYQELKQAGFEVLFDDRQERAGTMFADADLIGVPHRITIGEKSLKDGNIEYRRRGDATTQMIKQSEALRYLQSVLK